VRRAHAERNQRRIDASYDDSEDNDEEEQEEEIEEEDDISISEWNSRDDTFVLSSQN